MLLRNRNSPRMTRPRCFPPVILAQTGVCFPPARGPAPVEPSWMPPLCSSPLLAWLAWTSSSCELHSQQCYPAVPCFRCKRTFHLCFPQPGTQRASRSNCWVQVDMPVWLGTHRGGPLVPWQCLLCCMCLNSGKLRKLRPSLIFVTPLFLLLKDDSSVPVLSASLHLMGAD